MLLAQLQTIPWATIGTWLIGLIGALAVLVLTLHAVKLMRETFGHRPPLDSQVQRVMQRIDEQTGEIRRMEAELKLDGSRRSKTLFDHIKSELLPIHERLNDHDRKLTRHETILEQHLRNSRGKHH